MQEQNLNHSHIRNEDQLFLQFDEQGNTELIKARNINHKPGNSYRKVHYTRQDNIGLIKNLVTEVFKDPQWNVLDDKIESLDPNNGNVVLKRLIKLYPRTNRPPFFPAQKQSTIKVKDPHAVPYFLTEINLLPPSHYKSLFITQDYQENGLYHIIFNKDGRFETDVVDDWIPVYEDSNDPIWGMDINHPWQLILLKFWAKNKRSYWNVKNGKPFQFIEAFTNSNWKYWNLGIQGEKFLNRYESKLKLGKFICKTKFSNEVRKSGLVEGSAGYELVALKEVNKVKSNKKWLITLRSTINNKWTGGMSVVDKQVNKHYENNNYKIRLEKDFLMDQDDFLNLFAGVYVASQREKHDYYSNYYLVDVPSNQKRAIYVEFNVQKAGFFDFVIKQFPQNKKAFDNQRSRVKFEKNQKEAGEVKSSAMLGMEERYLKIKYMLVYDNRSPGANYNYPTKEDQDFPIPLYSAYDPQYSKGYNSGDASFQNVVPGRYVLKIKPETVDKNVTLCLNYCSNTNLQMKQIMLSKQESSVLMRESMISTMGKTIRATLDKNRKRDQISFGNYFESIGYGYIAIRSAKDNHYDILLEVDPILLQNEGYKLKNQFKRTKQPFGIIIKPGQQNCIVMTKLQGVKNYEWPPKAVGIFKDESQVKRKVK